MRGFLRVLLYVVLGPYVGLLAMALLIGSWTLATTGSPRDFTLGAELLSPLILMITYTVGVIPALLTGIAAIFVARRLAGWRSWLLVALIGGVVSFAGAFLVAGGGPEMIGPNSQGSVTVLLTLAGAIAGLVCAMVFDGFVSLAGERTA
jgi:4-amino-4-deoxy-L-arabinose transferase-like glycosyltransferase